jgi:hypothetical protein
MAYEQKDMSGSLFRNDRREKDTHPHAKGSALIGGVEYWVSAWTKEARDGSKYQSLSFVRKEPKGGYSGSYNGDPATNSSGGIGPQEDYPF